MGKEFINLTPEELCDLMCGGPEEDPWETEEFTDFLNDVNELATNKYGWNVDGYEFKSDKLLELVFSPAIGADAENRKF